MNELIFFSQIFLVLIGCWGASRFGKEGLTLSVVLMALCANFFVLKQISLFGFKVTCSDGYTIGSFVSLNLLSQRFGKESSKQAIKLTFLTLFAFAALSQLHLLFHPLETDFAHSAYLTLLKPAPRIFAASLFTFYLMQRFELFLFSELLNRTQLPFAVRSTLSLSLSQFLDTLLFTFLGLFGIASNLLHIVCISYAIKLIAIFAGAPLTAWISKRRAA